MRALRPLLDRLGGPDAVSWPLFWVTLVMNAAGHFAFPQPYVPLGARIAAVGIAQVLMFVPLLGIGWGLRRAAARPHPWLVIGTYIAATALRAVVFAMLLRAPDGSITVPFGARLASSLGLVLIMIATTLLVAASRQHAADMQRLLQVQRQLAETRDQSQRQLTGQNEAALAQVQEVLSESLVSLEHAQDDRARVAALRHLASEVIRPLSHELAQFTPAWSPEPLDTPKARVEWIDVVARISHRGSFRPVITALVMGLMTAAASLIFLRARAPAFLITVLMGTGFGLWGANAILDRTLPRKSVPASFGLVVIAALLVGTLTGASVPSSSEVRQESRSACSEAWLSPSSRSWSGSPLVDSQPSVMRRRRWLPRSRNFT